MRHKNKNEERKKLNNSNEIMQKSKTQKGITLVSLVVTIVILIILATVSINVLLGEEGLINQAKTAKFETEKAAAREQIEVVLLEAAMDKALNSEYNENEYLDKFVEDRLKGVWLEQDEISYDGFIFALDRSVPKLGNYTGQDEGPRIKEIKVIGKTTNSVSIEVDARNAEGGKYTYSYKKDSEGEEAWVEVAKEVEENTCTFDNLEENEIYNLKVKIKTSEGEIEQTINEMTGELPKGTITFDEVGWLGDGTAKVRINTTETGYTMQYIIVKQGESTEGLPQKNWSEIASGSEITQLYLGDTVYARLYDGKNESDYASVTVEDKIVPEVTVSPQGAATSNSITVSVSATDEQSGMKESLTYTYYIKKTGEGEGNYQVPVGATMITSSTYTFTELTQGTSYDVKVEVNGDKANNVGTGTLENQTTGTVPGAEGGLQTGNITASAATWSNGLASITLSTSTGLTIQYQVNNTTEGNWQPGTSVTGLHHGDTVYARLTDGNNYGDEASINILDRTPPTVNFSTTQTHDSISITVNATDGESGLADNNIYTYTINGGSTVTKNENTHTFSGLASETEYEIMVEVKDKANNTGRTTKTESTDKDPSSIESRLKAGDYVTYPSTQGNLSCRVLYDSSSGYGVQLITSACVGNDITLGSNVFSTSMSSYNNEITTLNNEAGNYNNSTYSTRARCVGSHPTNTSDNPGYFTSSYSYMSSYNGQFKDTDKNYEIDYNQMKELEINNINSLYVLASRVVDSYTWGTEFRVRQVLEDGSLGGYFRGVIYSDERTAGYVCTRGLRPVFVLKSGIKVTGGDGKSSETAYTLGV